MREYRATQGDGGVSVKTPPPLYGRQRTLRALGFLFEIEQAVDDASLGAALLQSR
jgi:hypothetical protein